jgi:hypothetical protein
VILRGWMETKEHAAVRAKLEQRDLREKEVHEEE